MQPGIITPRSFVWPEENWFPDWAWSCLGLGSLSLLPFVLLSWRHLIFSNIIDLTALTPFDKNWTELWHNVFYIYIIYSKYILLVTLWFKKCVNIYTVVHLFIVNIYIYFLMFLNGCICVPFQSVTPSHVRWPTKLGSRQRDLSTSSVTKRANGHWHAIIASSCRWSQCEHKRQQVHRINSSFRFGAKR